MKLRIISAEQVIFEGDVTSVTLPGEMGSFMVLKNHASLVSVLVAGRIKYTDIAENEHDIETKGGIVDVDNNIVAVCLY